MPDSQELQVLIMLALIPTVIAGMYSLVQVTEAIRKRQKPGGRAPQRNGEQGPLNRRISARDK